VRSHDSTTFHETISYNALNVIRIRDCREHVFPTEQPRYHSWRSDESAHDVPVGANEVPCGGIVAGERCDVQIHSLDYEAAVGISADPAEYRAERSMTRFGSQVEA
jgi:hypothetical protein